VVPKFRNYDKLSLKNRFQFFLFPTGKVNTRVLLIQLILSLFNILFYSVFLNILHQHRRYHVITATTILL